MANPCTSALLSAAIKDRARIYLGAFREISRRHGEAEAISILRSVSRAHGTEVGEKLVHLAPRDFAGMAEQWAKPPDGGETYATEIRQLDATGLEVQMMRCPLREGWHEAGCSDEEICTLLHCASAFDEAVLETAGFAYELELWSPGRDGCCRTRIWEKA